MPAEFSQGRGRLIDVAFGAVVASGSFNCQAAFDPGDVVAFAPQFRLGDISATERRGLLVSGQQVWMFRKKLPQNGQQPFVAQQHFPGWLDEVRALAREMRSEFFMP